jgi:hypothetical protein
VELACRYGARGGEGPGQESVDPLDAKIDDGGFARGSVRASAGSCRIGGEDDPLPAMAVTLPA